MNKVCDKFYICYVFLILVIDSCCEIMRGKIKYCPNGKTVFVLARCLLDYCNNFLSDNSDRDFDAKFNMYVQNDVIYRVWSIILDSNCFKTFRRNVHSLQKSNLHYQKRLLLLVKMAGRKRAIGTDQTYHLFGENQNKIIDERQKVIPKLAIWNELRKDSRINKQMTGKALYTDALKWWEKMKNKSNTVDVPSITNISSETTPNNISSEQSHHEQVPDFSSSPLDALEHLKTSIEFQAIIHMTGLCPFFVIYGSPKQFLLYNSYKSSNAHTKITC